MIQQTLEEVTGIVKWFDPAKGFGFIVSEGSKDDILLHANVLRNYGQSSVADGARIVFIAQATTRGIQATHVLSIEPPVTSDIGLADFEDLDPAELATIELEPARVKWFDKLKGFGFANIWGNDDDVFIHAEVLRRSGLADLTAGEAVNLRVMTGQCGKMAAEVCAWEKANKE